METLTPENSARRKAFFVLAGILFLRLISMGCLALSDPTEARYAQISLRMSRTGDFIMPWIDVEGRLIPYWGKPPLHFWLTSASYRLLGASEWSARLPSYLAGLLMVWLTWRFAKHFWNERIAGWSTAILASSGLFFFVCGASAIDATLSAAVTGAMVSFAFATSLPREDGAFRWGLLFFVFLAAGMMIKGPVAVALVVLSIVLWLLLTKQRSLLQKIPWTPGTLLFLLLSVPWFVLAEMKTPGFLRYFFINEHILRYLVHDYGDRYGSGHMYPRGTSWGMLLLTFLPWSVFLVSAVMRRGRTLLQDAAKHIWSSYSVIWGLTPALFFMLSRQLLATYVLPGFAGLSVAVALELTQLKSDRIRAAVPVAALILAILFTVATFALQPVVDDRVSAKGIIRFAAADSQYAQDPIVFPYEQSIRRNFMKPRCATGRFR